MWYLACQHQQASFLALQPLLQALPAYKCLFYQEINVCYPGKARGVLRLCASAAPRADAQLQQLMQIDTYLCSVPSTHQLM